MFEFLHTLISDYGFEPHNAHFTDNPGLMWLIVLANGLIVLSYMLIPIALLYIVRKRKDLVYNWIFLLFGGFIVMCGITHFMHIVTFWYPAYYLQATIQVLTVVASAATFFALLIPISQIVKLTTPKQLEEVGARLRQEIDSHKQSEAELAKKTSAFRSANEKIIKKNEELAKVNSFMAGRETKIAELKKQISELKKKHD